MSKLFALIDCNNFFVSCERVFNPALRHKPVIVLSNNDGCVIARSNEAKAVGIAMGVPLFKCRDVIAQHRVFVYSANFVLYGDISSRVMHTAGQFTSDMEVYSIDEAFLALHDVGEPHAYAQHIRDIIKRDIGMPVSIGVASTKTLAKIANHIAKKHRVDGAFCLSTPEDIDHWLSKTPVGDIWGIGYHKADFLKRQGIDTALQFKNLPDAWIKKHMTVISLKTAWELRGIECLESQDNDLDKKAIGTSRSFAHGVTMLKDLSEAAAAFTANACDKLRDQNSVCGYMQVYIMTNRFNRQDYYANSLGIEITPPTAYTPDLITHATNLIKRMYRPGHVYKKVGVVLSNLSPQALEQKFLYEETYQDSRKQRLMQTIDRFNRRSNSGKIFMAAEGIEKSWSMKQTYKSKRFTTRWDELLEVKA